MCIHFEGIEFKKINYWTGTGVKTKSFTRSTKTKAPKKIIEKHRLYEWVIAMFNEDVPNCVCITKDGFVIIKH